MSPSAGGECIRPPWQVSPPRMAERLSRRPCDLQLCPRKEKSIQGDLCVRSRCTSNDTNMSVRAQNMVDPSGMLRNAIRLAMRRHKGPKPQRLSAATPAARLRASHRMHNTPTGALVQTTQCSRRSRKNPLPRISGSHAEKTCFSMQSRQWHKGPANQHKWSPCRMHRLQAETRAVQMSIQKRQLAVPNMCMNKVGLTASIHF